jgi:hypothetical protein
MGPPPSSHALDLKPTIHLPHFPVPVHENEPKTALSVTILYFPTENAKSIRSQPFSSQSSLLPAVPNEDHVEGMDMPWEVAILSQLVPIYHWSGRNSSEADKNTHPRSVNRMLTRRSPPQPATNRMPSGGTTCSRSAVSFRMLKGAYG